MKSTSRVFLQVFVVIALISGLIGLGFQSRSAAAKPANALGSWTQQWADEFNGTGALSGSNWIYDIGTSYPGGAANWGTGEIESNTNSTNNVYQSGGFLYIKPIRSGSSWTSGRVETVRTDFQPPAGGGMAIEGRLQLPNVSGAGAQGIWPAFWALGAPFRGNYWNWPSIGEIDIMENINGQNTWYGTLHCGVNPGGPCNETTGIGSSASGFSPSLQGGFHTYRIEWDKSVSPNQVRWYVDGIQRHTVNQNQLDATTWNNAFNHGYFIILNVAVGGGWPGAPTASTTSGMPMAVDYVRVFYANGSGGGGPTATRTRTPTTGPSPTRTNTPVATGDFSQSVTNLSSSSIRINFVSNVNSAWVDVHYTGAPGLGQQNFRMARNGNTWTQTINGLSAGNVINYWFTYEKAGLAYDSAHFSYTK